VIESSNPAPVRSNAGTGRRLAPRTAPQYAACSAFRDTAFGHVLRVEEIPSEKGPPRKMYSLNAQGQEYLEELSSRCSFLAERLDQLHERDR
jgi:hypothetical protein